METLKEIWMTLWHFCGWLFDFGSTNAAKGGIDYLFAVIFWFGGISGYILMLVPPFLLVYFVLIRPFRIMAEDKRNRERAVANQKLYEKQIEKDFKERREQERSHRILEGQIMLRRLKDPEFDAAERRREEREEQAYLQASAMQEAIQPMMAAIAESSAAVNKNIERVLEQNKPGPLAWSEWLWQNPFNRQRIYNKLGRVLDKLDKA
ncbi:MAG: hypothetical protein MN733_28105 [Nitrososphaera sp.]|nr:hypothetical protein [Nitrososphaera sp.]